MADETRVLVVEDDRGIAESLVRGLRQAGYAVEGVRTGRAALSAPSPDVVLLDLGLPDIDGVEVCRRMRARSDAAIIAVTARGEEADRVVALDEGADDYLVKPFGLAELLARIRAVLRRRRPAEPEILRHGPLALDLRTRQISVDGRMVALTPKEFGILECLAADPGRVVSRQQILERAWVALGRIQLLPQFLDRCGQPDLCHSAPPHAYLSKRPCSPESDRRWQPPMPHQSAQPRRAAPTLHGERQQ
ncbi:response regulator transcription factor [Streptomyces sp. NPDC001739]